jgi:hypothetical protein
MPRPGETARARFGLSVDLTSRRKPHPKEGREELWEMTIQWEIIQKMVYNLNTSFWGGRFL